jgi:hypothetical protein
MAQFDIADLTLGVGATNRAIDVSNIKPGSYTLTVNQNAAGNGTISFPASWKKPGGLALTLSTTANATDQFTIIRTRTDTRIVQQKAFS